MDKATEFLKWFGELFGMFKYFPAWFQVACILSVLWFLVIGGFFIHFYSAIGVRLKSQTALTGLENNALSGDATALTKLSFSSSPKAYDILASIIQTSPDEQKRRSAISAIVNLKDKRTTTLLGGILIKEKWEVASDCAVALGRSKDPDAVPFLLRALQLHIDWLVGQKSAEALGSFEPTEPILHALVRAFDGDDNWTRDAAKQSLANYGSKALPVLVENLQQSTSYEGLMATIETIELIGDKLAVPRLEAFQRMIASLNFEEKQKHALTSETQKAIQLSRN